MRNIIAKHYPKIDNKVVNAALDIFYQLRKLGLERAPTTRELLNWLKYVKSFTAKESIEKIEKMEGLGALIKTQTDLERIQKMVLRDNEDFARRSNFN